MSILRCCVHGGVREIKVKYFGEHLKVLGLKWPMKCYLWLYIQNAGIYHVVIEENFEAPIIIGFK